MQRSRTLVKLICRESLTTLELLARFSFVLTLKQSQIELIFNFRECTFYSLSRRKQPNVLTIGRYMRKSITQWQYDVALIEVLPTKFLWSVVFFSKCIYMIYSPRRALRQVFIYHV